MKASFRSVVRRALPPVVVIVFLLLTWEGTVRLAGVPPYILPPPSSILGVCVTSFDALVSDLAVTAIEAVLGFLLGSTVAYAVAMCFIHRPQVERAFYPLAIAMKAVPVIAISPLLIIWCGNGLLSKVVMAALVSFFPVMVNMVTGLKQIDADAFDLFRLLSATRLQTTLHLRIPASLPYLFSSLKVASSLAVVGAIVAEFAGADKGLGYAILVASYRLETAQMFASIFYLALLGLAFFGIVVAVETLLKKFTGYIPEQAQERSAAK